jgi:hypothetical protein
MLRCSDAQRKAKVSGENEGVRGKQRCQGQTKVSGVIDLRGKQRCQESLIWEMTHFALF